MVISEHKLPLVDSIPSFSSVLRIRDQKYEFFWVNSEEECKEEVDDQVQEKNSENREIVEVYFKEHYQAAQQKTNFQKAIEQ